MAAENQPAAGEHHSRNARRRRGGIALAAVGGMGLLLGACTGTDKDNGSGPPAAASAPQADGKGPTTAGAEDTGKGAARSTVVDPRKIDPCEFVTGDVFSSIAVQPSAVTPPGASSAPPAEPPISFAPGVSFGNCDITVRVKNNGIADVAVKLALARAKEEKLTAPSDGMVVRPAAGMRIVSFPYQAGSLKPCMRDLVDTDLLVTQVEVKPRNQASVSVMDACAIADAVLDAGIKRLTEGQIKPRKLPANSIVKLRACELVDDAMMRAVPGLKPAKYPDETDLTCSVGDGSGPVMSVRLGQTRLPHLAYPGERQATYGDRHAVVLFEEAAPEYKLNPRCSVATQGGKLTERSAEEATVTVFSAKLPQEQICAAAESVARLLFAKLPQP